MKHFSIVTIAALALMAGAAAKAQNLDVGRLLVANASMQDPNFEQSVLLVLFHNDDIGTAGVLINRPTWVDATEAFPEDENLRSYDDALYLGGPLAVTELWALVESDGAGLSDVQAVTDSIVSSFDTTVLSQIDFAAADAPRVRVYAGRAEWGPGQLEREVERGDWRVLPASTEFVFADEPASLWRRMPFAVEAVTAALD